MKASQKLPRPSKIKLCNGFYEINGQIVKPDMEFTIGRDDETNELFYVGRDGEPYFIKTHSQSKTPLADDKLFTHHVKTWWNSLGRHTINKKSNTETVDHYKPGGENTPAIKVKGTPVITLPSGILRGLEWEHLTQREQEQIVTAYRQQIN